MHPERSTPTRVGTTPIRRRPRARPIPTLDLPERARALDLPPSERRGPRVLVQRQRIGYAICALWTLAEDLEANGLHAEALTVRAVVSILASVAHELAVMGDTSQLAIHPLWPRSN